MQGIHPADRVPLVVAVLVIVAANLSGFFLGITIYISILGAPFAAGAFALVRYLDDGTPYPAALSR